LSDLVCTSLSRAAQAMGETNFPLAKMSLHHFQPATSSIGSRAAFARTDEFVMSTAVLARKNHVGCGPELALPLFSIRCSQEFARCGKPDRLGHRSVQEKGTGHRIIIHTRTQRSPLQITFEPLEKWRQEQVSSFLASSYLPKAAGRLGWGRCPLERTRSCVGHRAQAAPIRRNR
jgi:hypothetical protein